MRLRERLWNPYALVFISSACIMVIELVASRLIAPRVGVSLYTWTSVIGVILAGISLGNYLGGRLADRFASTRLLGIIFGLASLGTLAILWLNNDLHEFKLPLNAPLMVWIVLYIAAVFMLPAVILGCVSPIIVKLSLTSLQRSGSTVGKIYAWSTVGSIVGTFATGFWLISRLGTKTTITLVAALLMLLAIWFLSDAPWRRALLGAGGALILFGAALGLLARTGFLRSECMMETDYFCINVHERQMGGRTIRELVLDRLVHSYADLEDPSHLAYGYEQTYAAVIAPWMARKPDLEMFFIGGGGYTFPRYMEAVLPESRLVVAEIDPGVTEAAHNWMGFGRDTGVITYNQDARQVLKEQVEPGSFDIVFGDAFNDFSVPYHLTTLEFGQLVARALRDDGLYLANIIDGGRHGHFLRAFVRTLREVFPHVAVIPSMSGWEDSERNTFVIVGSRQPLDLSFLPAAYRPVDEEEMAAYLAMEKPLILIDDYVPVDNLLAPVVADSASGFVVEGDVALRVRTRLIVVGAALGVLMIALAAWLVRRWRRARVDIQAQG
jgi:spermidine synthase